MKRPVIEIFGTGTHNRGAELMAVAIAERIRVEFPSSTIVVPPTAAFGRFLDRGTYGFYTSWPQKGIRTRILQAFAPKWHREITGVIQNSEIDVVLDASGFAFSDQWGARPARQLLHHLSAKSRAAQPLILLPQALGPFNDPEVAKAATALFSRATLVFARDTVSHNAASTLCAHDRLRQCPDFTVSVKPILPADVELPRAFTAVVPNIRMLDKTDSSAGYLEFLVHVIELLRAKQLNPVFLLHDAAEDRKVIAEVEKRSVIIPILEHSDPRVLKGILGRANFVIGSRFHALVSALAQGVPSIAAGWSHKYPELLRDFDASDLLLDRLEDRGHLDTMIHKLANEDMRLEKHRRIMRAAQSIKAQADLMWHQVFEIISRQIAK